jgi:ribose transport system substrate-binding protein
MSKKHKIIGPALLIGMALSGGAFAKDIVLAVMPAGMDTFGIAEARGFKQEAETLGARAIVVDSKWSVEKMANGIDDLIAQHVDAIALSPMDGVVSMGWVDKLVADKIPVVAMASLVGDPTKLKPTDVYPGLFAYVNHDDVQMGALSAGTIIPLLPAGKKAKIAVVEGATGFAVNDQRKAGFRAALDKAGVSYEVVADQPTDWSPEKAEAVCQNILTTHADVDVFFAVADPLAIGCSHAIAAAGSSAKVVSTAGGMKIGNAEIVAGTIAGSTCAKPETMGRLAAKAAYEAATNPKAVGGKYVPYEMIAITKNTVANCVPEW